MITKNHVTTIKSPVPGPTIAIFGGMHGDERGGILALEELTRSLHIKKGTVHLALANPAAVKLNLRQVNKNLNRCFDRAGLGTDLEDLRAKELMDLLDECDALLDLHNFPDPTGEPFIICEPDGLEVASRLGPKIISTGWTTAEPGASDGYMAASGKIGICMEGGPIASPTESKAHALYASNQFLGFFGLIDAVTADTSGKETIHATTSVIRHTEDFYLDPNLHNFEHLVPGSQFGHDGEVKYIAGDHDYIIFPWPDAKIGAEAYILGTTV